jgi:hypothetical protein
MQNVSQPVNIRNIQKPNTVNAVHLILLFLFLSFIVNGMIPQLEMLLFNGNIKIRVTIIKVLLLTVCILLSFLTSNRKIKKQLPIIVSWFMLVVYLSLITILNNSEMAQFLTSILSLYFFIVIIPVFICLQGFIDEKYATRLLTFLFLVLSILGIFQFLLKDPLLPVVSNDSIFKIYSWDNFDNQVRAFSLFDSGYSFGHFIAFMGAVFVFLPMHKSKKILLLCIVAFSGYSTMTRNTYLEIISVLISALIIKRTYKSKIAPYILLIVNGVFGYLIMRYADAISSMFTKSYANTGLMSTSSYATRVFEWSKIMNDWLNKDILTMLFGTGRTQGYGYLWVDNMYLAIGAQFGIIGAIIFAVLLISITKYIFKEARERQTPLSMSISAFWTSITLISFFNISLPQYILFFILMLLINSNLVEKTKRKRIRITL